VRGCEKETNAFGKSDTVVAAERVDILLLYAGVAGDADYTSEGVVLVIATLASTVYSSPTAVLAGIALRLV